MSIFYLGLILFFVPHLYSTLRSRVDGKDVRLKIGSAKYMGLYSIITGIGLGLIIWGYINFPRGDLMYSGPYELRHYSWLIMLLSIILLAAAYTPTGYIKRTVEHPMMLAVFLWALLHLALGGGQKRVLLFGMFAFYALVSLFNAYRRGTNLKQKSPRLIGDVLAIAIGLALTAVLFHGGHQALFGVPPV